MILVGVRLGAQSVLIQLGLTETAARNFLFDELSRPSQDRRSAVVVAGTRAFLKLPRSARASAATGLFAWARSHVNTPEFTAKYNQHRRNVIPSTRQYDLTVEQAVKQEIDQQLAGLQQSKQLAAKLPLEERGGMLEQIAEMEKSLKNPDFIKQMQEQLKQQRAEESGLDATDAKTAEERLPADPRTLFARRLREFLDATADVNFETRTISLTGGPDGIEFIDPKVRGKHWMWHEAVIVGPEATAAARAAAQTWLKELDR